VIALLANPDSGSGGADGVERGLRARGLEVARFELGHADDAVESSPERVIVAGGDGSIGPAADAARRASVPLGVVPVGTANDFARALELPDDPEEALELAAKGGRTACLDLGRFGDRRPFVNAASTGLSPVAARNADGLKGLLGPLSYTLGALRAGLFAQPVSARVTVDGSSAFDGRAWQVIVGVTGAFGGGAGVDADPSDGQLDAVTVEAHSRVRLALHGYGLRVGGVEEQEGVVTASGSRIEVETDAEAGFNVDGELVDERRLAFEAEPRAYEVVVGR